MSKKECELCPRAAAMFCDSDQASLCWECDEKVHAANFLVAKHSRTLLCHVCQSPTPWKAAGLKLTTTVSVCRACADQNDDGFDSQGSDEDDDSIEEYEDEEEEEEEEDGENQVVPLSAVVPSASEDNVSSSLSKRQRDTPRSESEEDEEESGTCSVSKHMRIGFPNRRAI